MKDGKMVEEALALTQEEPAKTLLPAMIDHTVFKQALRNAGFTRDQAQLAYTVITATFRRYASLGFGIDFNPVLRTVPAPWGASYSFKTTVNQAVERPLAIRYPRAEQPLNILHNPEWD